MRLSTHEARTLKRFGVKGTDIHQWIDAFFEKEKFELFVKTGFLGDFNPYDHRIHRHCQDALEECVEVFSNVYPEETVRGIFEQHVRDDYDGHYPERHEFGDPEFHKKHHSK